MSEQAPNNPDYLQQYPDAIQDPQKAEYMAYKGKQHEDTAAHLRKNLEFAAEHAIGFTEATEPEGDPHWDRLYSKGSIQYTHNHPRRGYEEANINLGAAESQLGEANEKADLAYKVSGKVYDIVKNSKR